MVLKGEVLDDQDRPIVDQTSTEMLVIELLDKFQVIDKKVLQRTRQLSLGRGSCERVRDVGEPGA